MQIVEKSIDMKSMKPPLLTQKSVHTIATTDDNR